MPVPCQEGKLRPREKHIPCKALSAGTILSQLRHQWEEGDALETDAFHLGAEGEHSLLSVLLSLDERAKKPRGPADVGA